MIESQRHRSPLAETEMAEEQHAPASIGQVERRTDYDIRRPFSAFVLKLFYALNEVMSACKFKTKQDKNNQ